MIASKNKAVAGTSQNRLHTTPVCLDSCSACITKAPAMHRAPKVGVEFKISATPLSSHRFEHVLQMPLRFGIRSIERIPGAVTPSTKRNPVGSQGRAIEIFYEPFRVLLEDMRFLFSDERSYPNCGLEATRADLP